MGNVGTYPDAEVDARKFGLLRVDVDIGGVVVCGLCRS